MTVKWFVSTHPHTKAGNHVTSWSAVASHVHEDGSRTFVRTFPPQTTDKIAFKIAKNWILGVANTKAANG